jgi:hypothetical protein
MSYSFGYQDKKGGWGIISTNLRKISEVTGLSYHKIYNWFRNGNMYHEDEDCVCYKTKVMKGNQRIKNQIHGTISK